jgi:2-polyprenyl-3-methyl-5-hydroxy-6-metoxy-1,4-benzoquinol methylase
MLNEAEASDNFAFWKILINFFHMELSPSDIKKLEKFFARLKTETYPEPASELHTSITGQMIKYFINGYGLSTSAKILDIGCGQGVALELFTKQGFKPVGITLNEEDLAFCRKNNFEVYEMDQSFLQFNDAEFDFIWCRHVLEHSIFPYFTLSEINRVVKPKAYIYVEVPAPGTSSNHEGNKNHYSVLGKDMWAELMIRSGFEIVEVRELNLTTLLGPDMYWAFILRKN